MIADLSHYQGVIDWAKASKHLDFVILRATVGKNIDKRYTSYTKSCREYKVPYGVYHYMKCLTIEEAKEEAQLFYKIASVEKPLFYVADLEYENIMESTDYDTICEAFIAELRQLGVKKVGLYTAQRFYPKCVKSQKLIDFNWIPRYGKDNGQYDPIYEPTCPYDLHQYTSKGYLEGTDGTVDLNRISGTKPIEWFIEDEEDLGSYLMTAQDLINKAIDITKNYKTIYMYATYGFQVTTSTIKSKSNQEGVKWWYNSSNISKLKKVANQTPPTWGFDCVNLFKGIFWGWTGDVMKEKGGAKYASNGVPDKNANGIFSLCLNQSSDFSIIQPGEAVWIPGHFGLYIGDGLVIECTPSWNNGVQFTSLENIHKSEEYPNRTWDKHGFLPWVKYPKKVKEEKDYELGERILKKGLQGKDVKALQEGLIQLNYDLSPYGADGEFGTKTEEAVKAFQKRYELTIDGIFGEKTYELFIVVTDNSGELIEDDKNYYKVTAKSAYLWNNHPNYGGKKDTIVYKAEKLQKPNFEKYIPIEIEKKIMWINSDYIE